MYIYIAHVCCSDCGNVCCIAGVVKIVCLALDG